MFYVLESSSIPSSHPLPTAGGHLISGRFSFPAHPLGKTTAKDLCSLKDLNYGAKDLSSSVSVAEQFSIKSHFSWLGSARMSLS